MTTRTKKTETELIAAEKVETKANPLRVVLLYLVDHWTILLFAILVAVGFLYATHFSEFFYGILRFAVVVLAGLALRDLIFKGTVRPYVNTGLLQADFAALPPVHKVWLSVVIIIALLSLAAVCLIHP